MLKDILSISGQAGLFKLVAQSQKSIIVESLTNKKRIPVYHTTKVSSLDDIAIYTEDEEVPLADIFSKIYKMENKSASSVTKTSSNDEIKEYFEDVLPNYDKERVYVSDMKKVLAWYNLLLEAGIITDVKEEATETSKDETSKEDAVKE